MGQARNWTKEEDDYLSDKWGTISVPAIANKLNRSEAAILVRVQQKGCGAFLESGDYITFNQLLQALGIQGSYKYKQYSWFENRGFPIKSKKVNSQSFKIVYIKEFWKWAEKNKTFLDFSKFIENALGKEPNWVKEKRRIDMYLNRKYKKTPWTPTDDARLSKLVKDFKYSCSELSQKLQRTEGAVQRRILILGLKERPLREDSHSKWEEWQVEILVQLIISGVNYEYMHEKIDKSSKAIRGKVYTLYGTERLDLVREKIVKGD